MIPSPLNTPGYRYATRKFTGDGVTTDYEFSFAGVEPGYISRNHVTVSIMDNANRVEVELPKETITWMGVNQLRLQQPYSEDYTIIIRRDTPKDKPLLDFNDGAILNEYNLNMTSQQAVYVAAEMVDRFADLIDLFNGVNQDVIDALDFAIKAYNMAVLALNRANAAWDLANSKPDNFLELDDTPNTYDGEAGNVVIVNPVETGLDMVPIDEVPGFRDSVENIIDDYGPGPGPGPGDGIPLTAPVLLHESDPSVPNGAQLVAGANVNLSYNVDGELVVSSTGGGEGLQYGFKDGEIREGFLTGTWASTNGHIGPESGSSGYNGSLSIGNTDPTYGSVKFGLDINLPGSSGNQTYTAFGKNISVGSYPSNKASFFGHDHHYDLGVHSLSGLSIGDSSFIGRGMFNATSFGSTFLSSNIDYKVDDSIVIRTPRVRSANRNIVSIGLANPIKGGVAFGQSSEFGSAYVGYSKIFVPSRLVLGGIDFGTPVYPSHGSYDLHFGLLNHFNVAEDFTGSNSIDSILSIDGKFRIMESVVDRNFIHSVVSLKATVLIESNPIDGKTITILHQSSDYEFDGSGLNFDPSNLYLRVVGGELRISYNYLQDHIIGILGSIDIDLLPNSYL